MSRVGPEKKSLFQGQNYSYTLDDIAGLVFFPNGRKNVENIKYQRNVYFLKILPNFT